MMDFPSSSSAKVNDDQDANEDVGTDEMMGVTDGNQVSDVSDPTQAPTTMLLPSLRGKLMSDGGTTNSICRGVWAMNDDAHDIPEQCSDFEFKLVKATDPTAGFPFSGKYTGWFLLKQPPPYKPMKVDDKDMYITFVSNGDGSYQVEGRGANKFGKFHLRGTLGSDHMIKIYREYLPKPVPAPRKRSATAAGMEGGVTGPDGTILPPPKKPTVAPARDTTVKRDRKPSLTISDPSAVTVFTRPPSTKHATAGSSSSVTAAAVAEQGSGRTQRPPPHVQKCQDLWKDMSKLPQAVWFLEPVDYIKLNLLEYPSIIKHPMDFKTIKTNLDNGVYTSADAFAAHMRLVFQNAMTYNQLKDNPVHIAASYMSSRFEERYRQMLVSLNRAGEQGQGLGPGAKSSSPRGAQATGRKSMSAAVSSSKGQAGSGKPYKQQPGGAAGGSARARSTGPGPRPPPGGGASTYGLPPPLVDGSTEVFFAMKRQMDEMANELKTLRTKVMQPGAGGQEGGAANAPLTMTEKKTLVKDVQKLIAVPELLSEVIRILSESGVDTSAEVDFECMPTHAQRILQALVADNKEPGAGKAAGSKQQAGRVKKEATAAQVKSSAQSGAGRPSKRQTASSSSSSSSSSTAAAADHSYTYNQTMTGTGTGMGVGVDPMAHLGMDVDGDADVLLFPTEDFDELRADAAAGGGGDGDAASDDEEEEEAGVTQEAITVSNASAWNVKPASADSGTSSTATTTNPPSAQGLSSTSNVTDGLDHGTDEWVAAAVELQAQQQRQEERKDEGARIAAAKRAAEEERIRALRHAAQHQAEEARQREEDEIQQKAADEAALWARRDAERRERESLVKTVDLDHADLTMG